MAAQDGRSVVLRLPRAAAGGCAAPAPRWRWSRASTWGSPGRSGAVSRSCSAAAPRAARQWRSGRCSAWRAGAEMPAADSASWLLAGSGDAAWLLALAIALTALASWLACGAVMRLLVAWRVYDAPNRRSNHAVAKPSGAGMSNVQGGDRRA